jgi:hypothetical protein
MDAVDAHLFLRRPRDAVAVDISHLGLGQLWKEQADRGGEQGSKAS